MALGRFKAKKRGPGGGLRADGKLKKGCRFLKGGRISCKTAPDGRGGYRAKRASAGVKVRVSRGQAINPRTGKLKKGCRFVKGGAAICVRRRRRRG